MNEPQPVDITPALVAGLVAEQFPEWSQRSIKMVEPGGWDNRTFKLGNDLLVRLPSHERYVAQVAKEQRWLPWLARSLSVRIPVPVALGRAGLGYPWPWSIYEWLPGETATSFEVGSAEGFAEDLAEFLRDLQALDPTGGPLPGEHNFFRGGSLTTYDLDTRRAIAALATEVDVTACARVWDAALAATHDGANKWLHGDVAASNLLSHERRLVAVLDFGMMAVGDVACDLTIAWTLFGGHARRAFRQRLGLDDATWDRAKGWALWKALILLAYKHGPATAVADAARVLDAVLAEAP